MKCHETKLRLFDCWQYPAFTTFKVISEQRKGGMGGGRRSRLKEEQAKEEEQAIAVLLAAFISFTFFSSLVV